MTKHIVVVGSINMDLVLPCARLPRPGETVMGRALRTEPGGKGANQAVAAARLGARVAFVGCVGEDAFGARLLAGFHAEGVDTRHVRCIDGMSTGVAMIQVDDEGQNSIVLGPGANEALSVAQVDAASALIASAGLLVCQLETPLAATERAIAIAHAAGVPVLLNPAPARALPAALLRQVDVLVPNEGEAALLTGLPVQGRAGAAEAAAQLRRAGCASVLITLGADGVLVADAQAEAQADAHGSRHHPAPVVTARDTTGAGDTFIGAYAAARMAGEGLDAAIAFAQRAAAFSVQRLGAQAAMPTQAELRRQ